MIPGGLIKYFPQGTVVGTGVALPASPFARVCATEYYDGPTAGLAFFDYADEVASFQKIWWDDFEDNRLFDVHIFGLERLTDSSGDLASFLLQARAGRWSVLDDAKHLMSAQHIMEHAKNYHVARMVILARNIAGPLFVLPYTNGE